MALKYTEANKQQTNTTIVLIHAFPLNRNFWQQQIDALSTYARVIAPDLPGLGESPAFTQETPTINDYAQYQLNIRKAVFAGCSMGGYILFEIWRIAPERVTGLILCNTRADPDSDEGKQGRYKAIEQIKAEGMKLTSENMINKVFSQKMIPLKPQKVEQVKQWILHAPTIGAIHGNLAMISRVDSNPTLNTITVPTMLICGNEDPLTGETVMKPIKEGIKGCKYVVIDGAGHLAPWDSGDEVNKSFVEFLTSDAVREQFQ